jgi:hypothetical protein
MERGEPPTVELLQSLRKTETVWKHRDVCAWHGSKAIPICGSGNQTAFAQPAFVSGPFSEIVRDRGSLYP